MDTVGYLQSPIGWLKFVLNADRQLVRIDLNVPPPLNYKNPALFKDICAQFSEYFAGVRRDFTLPFCLNGSAFEMRVWEVLLQIPYSETRSYGEIAAVCGNPKAARAVGQAVHRNPLLIIVPCHRVVGTSNLGGYAGGLAIKRFLLRLEGARKKKGEVFLVKNSTGCYSDSLGALTTKEPFAKVFLLTFFRILRYCYAKKHTAGGCNRGRNTCE